IVGRRRIDLLEIVLREMYDRDVLGIQPEYGPDEDSDELDFSRMPLFDAAMEGAYRNVLIAAIKYDVPEVVTLLPKKSIHRLQPMFFAHRCKYLPVVMQLYFHGKRDFL